MLSDGNIQKVVVARELTSHTKLIVCDQPTRGIDVGATEIVAYFPDVSNITEDELGFYMLGVKRMPSEEIGGAFVG